METINEIIKIWNDNKVTYCEMDFSCGGDSMNEWSFTFYTDDDTIVNDDLYQYFDDEVFKRVDFYVNSDGHYLGENGIVHIEMNNGGDDFEYSKNAQSEWSETISSEILIKLTDEQVEFIRLNVADFNGGFDEGVNVNYKRDFVMTDKLEKLEKELLDLIENTTTHFTPNTDDELQEYHRFETEDDLVNENNELVITIHNEVYIYTDSE